MVTEYSRHQPAYTAQTAQRVLTGMGLPAVESVMNRAGWHWVPALKTWVFEDDAAKAA